MHLNAGYNTETISFGPQLTWWRKQMETFYALLAFFVGNSPVAGEFPTQRQVTRSFDVFFDLRLNKRLSKQPWGWRFETPSRSSWLYFNGMLGFRLNLSVTWNPFPTCFGVSVPEILFKISCH